MVSWLGYLALTQVARIRFPVSESFLMEVIKMLFKSGASQMVPLYVTFNTWVYKFHLLLI